MYLNGRKKLEGIKRIRNEEIRKERKKENRLKS
jgi:hypothetical protein